MDSRDRKDSGDILNHGSKRRKEKGRWRKTGKLVVENKLEMIVMIGVGYDFVGKVPIPLFRCSTSGEVMDLLALGCVHRVVQPFV